MKNIKNRMIIAFVMLIGTANLFCGSITFTNNLDISVTLIGKIQSRTLDAGTSLTITPPQQNSMPSTVKVEATDTAKASEYQTYTGTIQSGNNYVIAADNGKITMKKA